jgi:glycerate kinase
MDVRNRLLGARGCTRVYGPQKGLRPQDFVPAERALRRLRRVVAKAIGRDPGAVPGSGAAGGLGFGLMGFLGARPVPGFDLFARWARLEDRLRGVDLVITGEGAVDRSSLMGKGTGEIARRCRERGVRCVGLAGVVRDGAVVGRFFQAVHALVPGLGTEVEAGERAASLLEKLARSVARSLAEASGRAGDNPLARSRCRS